ncbi:G1/S-specific cyclin-E1 [Blastocystis sp. ATCC 50177/Nand II]|uniref:G1/S-specific cyclin-E1 n=1 Tax=Blastocystis sp. subtype 1 (strain ATCC 50177 / NandII) TaxID=478820 RepID=A0A196SLM2_BLAHN|nr:G1/S-specific cyclin-E1 [Blastocystis sp. ATCC 50177/Nand II]
MDVTRRFFAKIYHFKEEYPELAKHIHPDSMKLFNAEYRNVAKREASQTVLTPNPQLKKSRIQKPSPTKVADELNTEIPGYSDLNSYLIYLNRVEPYSHVKPGMDDQMYITASMRAILVDWMSELCYNYSLHRVTFHTAVNLLDRTIGINHCIKKTEFQAVGAVCVVIAIKLWEPVSINLDMIIQSTGGSCTAEQISSLEKQIVDDLHFHLMSSTIADWVLFFVRKMGDGMPFDLYFRCMDLGDRLLLDYNYVQFSTKDIALAIVSAFCCENKALQSRLTKLFDEFKLRQDCVKWVLDTGLSAPSHPLIQLLDSEEGAKTRNAIESRRDMYMEFNYVQSYNQLSLSHYSSKE